MKPSGSPVRTRTRILASASMLAARLASTGARSVVTATSLVFAAATSTANARADASVGTSTPVGDAAYDQTAVRITVCTDEQHHRRRHRPAVRPGHRPCLPVRLQQRDQLCVQRLSPLVSAVQPKVSELTTSSPTAFEVECHADHRWSDASLCSIQVRTLSSGANAAKASSRSADGPSSSKAIDTAHALGPIPGKRPRVTS